MSKDFGAGYCIHCREYAEELTNDHVPPESWYSDSTPLNLEKWRAPACRKCNSEYGKLERSLFQRLALGVEPWIVGGEGVGERALRSFDPRAAKNPKDRAHRVAALERVRNRLKHMDNVDQPETVLPNIGTIGPPSEQGYAIDRVEWDELRRYIEKLVRGISFVATQRVLHRVGGAASETQPVAGSHVHHERSAI
jgi:hypothetical protein